MTPNEIRRIFPNASASFLKRMQEEYPAPGPDVIRSDKAPLITAASLNSKKPAKREPERRKLLTPPSRDIIIEYFVSQSLPRPEREYRFHPDRKWRFDYAFIYGGLAVEKQGAIFTNGRHTRGAALLKEYEKLNAAAELGWRVLFFTPQQICTMEAVDIIRRALR